MDEIKMETTSVSLNEKIKNYFSKSNWINLVALFGFLMFTVSVLLMIVQITEEIIAGDAISVFFGTMDMFTNQSNFLLWIFMLFFIFFPKHNFLKNNKFLIWTMVYIFFTFFGYNVILVGINKVSYSGGAAIGTVEYNSNVASSVWKHVLSPIYFLVFGFLYMYANPNKQPKFLSTLLCGMIYPTIYVIYVIAINYTYELSPGQYYTVYGNATNVHEYPTAWVYIMVMWLIFFPGFYTVFYYCWKGFNKLDTKKI